MLTTQDQLETNELIEKAWQQSFFKTLAHRRGHRFGRGYELKDAPFPYKSDQAPVPLSEPETALLCWAGNGITGAVMGDVEVSFNTFMAWNGRTYPTPCNDQHQDLLYINDEGVFLHRPKDATRTFEIETGEDRERLLANYQESRIKIADERPYLPPASALKINTWHLNRPGQTLFLPVVNITYEYLNFLLLSFDSERYQMIDDRTGKPAGVGKWIDTGFLNGPTIPLSMMDVFVSNVMIATGFFMGQNINLASTAIGLGSFVWSGFTALVVMGGTPLTRGLGFRYVTGKDGMPAPVGLDGYIEALCPPYVKNMDEAVDRVVDLKFGPHGLFSPDYPGQVIWRDRQLATMAPKYSKEGIACTKAYCNYVYDTYGRFPAFVDPIQLPVAVTAHHLDFDFYRKYYPAEALTEEQLSHMQRWHGCE